MAFDASLSTRILERALKRGLDKARTYCTSKTLSRAMYQRISFEGKVKSTGQIRVAHYWARYFHDGINARVGKVMVWFKNPADDPRLKGGYPVQRNQVKRLNLSKKEFFDLKAAGKLIVTKFAGPTKKPQNPFFSNTGGMAGFDKEVDVIAQQETYNYVEARLRKSGLKNKKIVRNI